jgi:hypothetical protein
MTATVSFAFGSVEGHVVVGCAIRSQKPSSRRQNEYQDVADTTKTAATPQIKSGRLLVCQLFILVEHTPFELMPSITCSKMKRKKSEMTRKSNPPVGFVGDLVTW